MITPEAATADCCPLMTAAAPFDPPRANETALRTPRFLPRVPPSTPVAKLARTLFGMKHEGLPDVLISSLPLAYHCISLSVL